MSCSKANNHFVISNRQVVNTPKHKDKYLRVGDDEYMRIDGKEPATYGVRFGTYSFDDLKDHGRLSIIPEKDFDELWDEKDEKLPSHKVFKSLYDFMSGEKAGEGEVLVFVHGYNADLKDALEILRKIDLRYAQNPKSPIKKIVMFTWPSMSKALQYKDDLKDAKPSGYALARTLKKLVSFYRGYLSKVENCQQRIHLFAHSMGNQVLQAMMAELNDMDERDMNGLFDDVFLLGADVDCDALEKPNPMYDLTDICERVHVLVHKKDQALMISEGIKHSHRRLGNHGLKSSNGISTNIFVHDITNTKDDLADGFVQDRANHWGYLSSTQVIDLINGILRSPKIV